MCGITGIVGPLESTAIDPLIRSMTDLIVHRGPDSDGLFVSDGIGLGHRRLAVIDVAEGQQPMHSPDGGHVIVYNGEVYNFPALRERLKCHGHTFRTHCDTEVILAAYLEWGQACVSRLRGMFAFAIYDRNTNSLFAARDRLGIKPFYYMLDGSTFLFGSEVKSVLAGTRTRPSTNCSAIDFFISLGYVPGETTLFQGIMKLAPGHTLTFENGRLSTRCYWDLPVSRAQPLALDDALPQLNQIMRECVEMHMISDVPLGAFLSGGLDSSAIVALMAERSDAPVKTFSVGYRNEQDTSELPYARRVADHFGTEHFEFLLEPEDFFESIGLLLEHSEEPLVESAGIALYRLAALAKRHVTVVMSGEGGDEALAGYPLYQITDKIERVRRMVPGNLVGGLARHFARTEKQQKYVDWLATPLDRRYQGISNDVTQSIRARLFHRNFLDVRHSNVPCYFSDLLTRCPDASRLQRLSYADIKTWLPDDLLLKADKMTMAASLELRVPFLDHEFLEFCLRLPDEYRLQGNEGKFILKKAMEGILPREIIYRKKQGFPVPIASWFRNELREKVAEVLRDPVCLNRGYFNPCYINEMLDAHNSGRQDLSRRIFTLLTLELWHRRFIDGAAA